MINKTEHLTYLKRCVYLARKGQYGVQSNPRVGCVIVYNKKIIGEGYHQKKGSAHAEVNAINSVKNKALLPSSRMYVSLEPCGHVGLTPPCADLIIEHQIPKVIIGLPDPFQNTVAKGGMEKLKAAGIDVLEAPIEPFLADENAPFLHNCLHHMPYVILKWAESKDGFLDKNFSRTKVSNQASQRLTHSLRAQSRGILIGRQTFEIDLPSLSTRFGFGNSPTPIILDPSLKLGELYSKYIHPRQKAIILNCEVEQVINQLHFKRIDGQAPLRSWLYQLYQEGIDTLLVEGGSKTLQTFIDQKIWNEAIVFRSSSQFYKGTKGPLFYAFPERTWPLDDNQVLEYKQSWH